MGMLKDPEDEKVSANQGILGSLAAPSTTSGGAAGGRGAPAAAASVARAPGSTNSGSGWVNLQDIFALNRGGAASTAADLAGGIERDAGAAKGMADSASGQDVTSGQHQQAQEALAKAGGEARSAADQGGLEALISGQHPGETSGGRGMDAFLAGAAGADRFASDAARFGGLADYFTTAAQPSAQGSGPSSGSAYGEKDVDTDRWERNPHVRRARREMP